MNKILFSCLRVGVCGLFLWQITTSKRNCSYYDVTLGRHGDAVLVW